MKRCLFLLLLLVFFSLPAYAASSETYLSDISLGAYFRLHPASLIMILFVLALGVYLGIRRIRKEQEYARNMEDAKKEAEEANRAKSRFLANMSHDIRTPMNAILGFTDIALANLDNPEKLEESLHKIRDSGNILLSLINSVLEMSRIEFGQEELDLSAGDVMYSFENLKSALLELAEEKNIDLRFEFGEIKDRYVYADFQICLRVFMSIITNSIDYTQSGGTVVVRCEQTGKKDDCGIYRYTFTDNGIGMSEEFQKHLFDEFAREQNSTVSGVQGTGLGLSMAKSLVTLMDGTIECQSKQGEGSTFTVTLPFKLQSNEELAQYVDPSSRKKVLVRNDVTIDVSDIDFTGKRILLVEDNELNREIAGYILSEENFIVEEADDGTTAVKMVKEKGPDYYDAILMDVQMPIMDGHEATRTIRKLYPDSNLPIIALSANAFEEDRERSLASGMNAHIAKPVNIKELLGILAQYI